MSREPVLVTVIRWAITVLGVPVALYGGVALVGAVFRILGDGVFTKLGTQMALGVILLVIGLGLIRAAWKDPSLERLADGLP